MAETIHDMMGAVLTRWTMGAAAASAAPVWKVALGADPAEAELRLLALSGQFLGVAVTAEPPAELHILPDLPALALPVLPDPLRPLFRRLLSTLRDAPSRNEVLHFLAGRGRIVHPDDWTPAAGDDEAPDVYAPWRDWAEAADAAEPVRERPDDTLTAENWDDFWPAMRKLALADLRRKDPAAARTLMAAKFPNCGADERLRLLGLMATGLSDDDREFLQALAASDRAPKVKALASALLGRLGHGLAANEEAKELAGFFEIKSRGWLRRTKVIAAREIKNHAQENRRRQLFAETEMDAFASALGMAPEELGVLWVWGQDRHADIAFAGMAVRSAPDRAIDALAAQLREQSLPQARIAGILRPRLSATQRSGFGRQALANGDSFVAALAIAGPIGRIDKAIDTPTGGKLTAALAPDSGPAALSGELHALGLLASRAGAAEALDRLSRAGLLTADPRLDMLRLNAALDEEGVIG